MAIWPKCPSCGADSREHKMFRLEEVEESREAEEERGTLVSAAHLICVTCSFKFPLWTYTMGDHKSFRANATNDDGSMWDPEVGEPWWNAGGVNLTGVTDFEEVVTKSASRAVYFRG